MGSRVFIDVITPATAVIRLGNVGNAAVGRRKSTSCIRQGTVSDKPVIPGIAGIVDQGPAIGCKSSAQLKSPVCMRIYYRGLRIAVISKSNTYDSK
ncbi:hypothetical protein D3C72_565140 [compost metagenome]